jgi:hypothetical protein
MGEDRYCADQTRHVCGNSVDDPVLDIRGVADSLVPQEKSTVVVQRNDPIDWREIALGLIHPPMGFLFVNLSKLLSSLAFPLLVNVSVNS